MRMNSRLMPSLALASQQVLVSMVLTRIRTNGIQRVYRVVWLGYPAESATWERASNISDDLLA